MSAVVVECELVACALSLGFGIRSARATVSITLFHYVSDSVMYYKSCQAVECCRAVELSSSVELSRCCSTGDARGHCR